ncbi:hypothetical protein FACS1894184_13680 [Clostridia bacterium]|nr:hypothetical protein FACS1894184_13680 [Clostridia bacterium]
MIQANDLARKAVEKVRTPPIPYALGGRSDAGTDCINLVGWCVQELGGRKEDIPKGSNTAWRTVMQGQWTLQEAKKQGKLIPGALVYIKDAPSEQWPDGDFAHVGVYVGKQNGWSAGQVIVHASASRNGVYPSTIKNAWTHVAWLKCVDYTKQGDVRDSVVDVVGSTPPAVASTTSHSDSDAVQVISANSPIAVQRSPITAQPSSTINQIPKRGIVTAGGDGLLMREAPNSQGKYILKIPGGSIIDVITAVNGWYQTRWLNSQKQSFTGWVSADYVAPYTLPIYEQTQPVFQQPTAQVPNVALNTQQTNQSPNYPQQHSQPQQPIYVNVTVPQPEPAPKKPNLFRRIISAIRGY